jgi:hypothetical protein
MCNEKLCELYRSPSIVRVVTYRRLRSVEHKARLWRKEKCIKNFGGETSWNTWNAEKYKEG